MFDVAENQLQKFKQSYPSREMHNWWTWWRQRKHHVFRAFKPSLNAPRVNLAECGHSSWKNSGLIHLDLLDAARQDVAENIQLRSNLQGYEQGTFRAGNGPGLVDIEKRSYADQAKRAQAFSNELLKYIECGQDAPQPKSGEKFVDERSSHRHDPPRSQKQPAASKPAASKPARRPCPIRKSRSKTFTRVLDIAKKMKGLKVTTVVVVDKYERHYTLTAASGVTYDVEIKAFPNCSCRYCSERDICSHIVWLLLHKLKVPEHHSVLQQRGYTGQEIEDMFATGDGSSASISHTTCARSSQKPTASKELQKETWMITKHTRKTRPRCPTCRTEIKEGDLKISCNARWTPPHKTQDGRSFTVPRTFYFCLKWECVSSTIPKGSTITNPPDVFRVDQNAQITPDEWQIITFLELPLMFE